MKSQAVYLAIIAVLAGALAWTRLVGDGSEKTRREAAKENESAAPPAEVKLFEVRSEPEMERLETVGTVAADRLVSVSAKIVGHVSELRVELGDRVKAGDVLVVLRAEEIGARLQQARAAKLTAGQAENEAAFGELELEAALAEIDQNILAAESQADKARAGLELNKKTFERFATLRERRSASQQEYDEASARLKAAEADLAAAERMTAAAKSRRRQAEEKIGQVKSRRRQAESQAALAESAVREAKAFEAYTTIAAPMDGEVVEKFVEPGQLAAPGQPLLTLSGGGSFNLETDVPEAIAGSLEAGAAAVVTFDGREGKSVEGRIVEVSPSVDRQSRTARVKVALPEGSGWKNGQFARARFDTGRKTDVLKVPEEAVLERGQLRAAFKAEEDGTLRMRAVRVGRVENGMAEILGGLRPGDRIVADGLEGLEDGGRWTERREGR